jgi:hypothetical protein
MPKGATFLAIKPFKLLAAKFTTLWYLSNMRKQWQTNMFSNTYYLDLKRSIEVEPRMTLNTLQRFEPRMKFRTDRHFIYITTRVDDHKDDLQSYYKLKEEDLEEITMDWSKNLLIPIYPAEMSNPDSPETMHKEHDTPRPNRRKKTEEVQDLSSASINTSSISLDRGGDDEVEEKNGKEAEQKQGEVTPPRDETNPLKKRKVYPPKPSSWKKSKATVTKMQIVLTIDDFEFIIAALNDAS